MESHSNAQAFVEEFLEKRSSRDTLRFITCGSVDDGKSTLIGRMLFESQLIFEDQLAELKKESSFFGERKEELNFALLVDGLSAEREQGITIDVAYRFFATEARNFICADTPGHEQYTKNMVTGASTADLAVVLIDATKGVVEQTQRHSILCSLLGINHIVIAVNKMDLVEYNIGCFDEISAAYQCFAKKLDFASVTAIPISAMHGENVVLPSKKIDWYRGPALLQFLETVQVHFEAKKKAFRFPVQWVNRPNSDFRGFSGKIEAGFVSVGDEIMVMPSLEKAKVKEISIFNESPKKAYFQQCVTIRLDKEIDVSRGDLLVDAASPCASGDQFQAQIIWFDKKTGFAGREYLMKIGTRTTIAKITLIKHKIDISSLRRSPCSSLQSNDVVSVHIKTSENIPFEPYKECPSLGSFIIIDRINYQTLGCGMIEFALRRSENIKWQTLDITKAYRRKINGHSSKMLWFTGLSGSGKSTIANALEKRLYQEGVRTYLLDGDNIRRGLNQDLGFSDEHRIENIRRIAEVGKLMVDAGLIVLAASISPFEADRKMARAIFENEEFVEIFVDTPLHVAEDRDPKGLYKKARSGQIPNFTGIDSPYENPKNPDLRLQTEIFDVEQLVQEIMDKVDFYSILRKKE